MQVTARDLVLKVKLALLKVIEGKEKVAAGTIVPNTKLPMLKITRIKQRLQMVVQF